MNNFSMKLKKFFQNKNTVTILGVIVVLVLLYIGYSTQINKAVDPLRVPVAKATIQPRTEITSDMIEYVEMPKVSVEAGDIYTNSQYIIGKYSNINSVIPQGSMFYKDLVINKTDLPNISFIEVEDGQAVYNFPVDIESTYGNSMMPGDYIDLYMKATSDGGQLMVGKLVSTIKILAVKDSSGNNVFEDTTQSRTPAMLIFGVDPDINILLRKASYMASSYGVELFPVPQGGSVDTEGKTYVSTQALKDFINARTVDIPEDVITDTEETGTTDTTDTTDTTKKSTKSTKSKTTTSKASSAGN